MARASCPSAARARLALAIAAALVALAAADTMHLSAESGGGGVWTLKNGNGTVSFSELELPVYPHQVLQSKGVIGDPLYRYNELETRWVSDETWTYAREFSASASQAASPAADLVFKGLDTFASVSLNGAVILRADNFHRTWRVPVQGLLKVGKNTLSVTVDPALTTTLRLKKDLPYTVSTLAQPGALDVFNYVRKGAYSFGWGESFVLFVVIFLLFLLFSSFLLFVCWFVPSRVGCFFELVFGGRVVGRAIACRGPKRASEREGGVSGRND